VGPLGGLLRRLYRLRLFWSGIRRLAPIFLPLSTGISERALLHSKPLGMRKLGRPGASTACVIGRRMGNLPGAKTKALMTEVGFKETCFGSGKQAVIKYCPTNPALSADLEFLCPLSPHGDGA